ncbi:MAG: hypothetical protein D6689_07075 [Deltaproteobacteria bacterium]|nr:MAG: hypothetical protein D6689_07075 [Deltaproteobacteria bacterium]
MPFASLHVDQSGWGCVRVTGPDRIRFLQGMCTANIAALGDGQWTRACMLDAKGHLVSVFDALVRAEDVLLLCQPGVAEATRDRLARHAIMDEVDFELADVPVHRVWAAPQDVWSAPPVLAPCPEPVAPPEAVDIRRIEAGLPLFGVDVDDKSFPFESPLRATIDYDKGCYLGQEPVARVRHQGRPAWELVGLRFAGDEPPPDRGSPVAHADRPDAGHVTSSARSPVFGPIALARLRRAAAEPGTRVQVAGREAIVCALPFDTRPEAG